MFYKVTQNNAITMIGKSYEAIPQTSEEITAEKYNQLMETIQNKTEDTVKTVYYLSSETGTYTGTGTYGSSNPNSLTFDFVPKVVEILGYTYMKDGSEVWVDCRRGDFMNPVMLTERLTEEFVQGCGLMDENGVGSNVSFGKKSADGKTVFWYVDNSANPNFTFAFNDSGYRYYYSAMG